jgi:hypothetical protein
MDLSPSKMADSSAATEEFYRTLWNLTFLNRAQKSPPVVSSLSQATPVHTTSTYVSPRSIHSPTSRSS